MIRQIEPISPIIAGFVAKLTPDQRDEFEELAASLEFHHGKKREDAERLALACVTKGMKEAGDALVTS